MNNYSEKLQNYATKVLAIAKRYAVIIFVVVFSALSGFLVMRIGELSRAEPEQAQIDLRLEEVKRTKLDEDTISKLRVLQDKNISIESLFDNGRTNPFED